MIGVTIAAVKTAVLKYFLYKILNKKPATAPATEVLIIQRRTVAHAFTDKNAEEKGMIIKPNINPVSAPYAGPYKIAANTNGTNAKLN